jgi:hypothetical protein
VVAKGYLTKLLANAAVKSYIEPPRARDFEPPGAGGQHRQHGRGGAAATAITHRFLQRKMDEYEALKAEIEALKSECDTTQPVAMQKGNS